VPRLRLRVLATPERYLTWQKGDKENPRKDPEKIKERNKKRDTAALSARLDDIKAERLVVCAALRVSSTGR